MKKWIKIMAFSVAALNLVMLAAALCPVPFVSTGQVAFAGDDHPTLKAQPLGDDQPDLTLPDACKFKCRGFWRCFKSAIKCLNDLLF